ncbi:IgGFc-binding protein isoform X2 [Cyclopterus lumpus]|uniref:IgGFc-binding protein isoform X2 n=1 Tax=Cyclopterus lumpus TaxID=8103 RepID=UPI001486D896|nr:IgGFc-binding protein isoform X2 [Cyclopterus lumpus]
MGPVLLLMMLAAENSEVTATPPEHSTGLKFVVAFPENIAYYHPVVAQNMVQLTALYDDTSVNIKSYTFADIEMTLSQGESKNYTLDERMESNSQSISDRVLQITSNNLITVHAINQKQNSVQTALVLPTDKLAKEYLIPPVPEIQGTTLPVNIVTAGVTERGPFRLVIVNGENAGNIVTVKGTNDEKFTLESNHIVQIWLGKTEQFRSVTASYPVAVLFGHTCAMRSSCICGQLYAALPPAKEEKLKFYIPPALANGTEAFVLVSEKTGTKIQDFNPASPLVETAGTAIFYHQGLLLPLIPDTDFAACYVVHSILDTQNFVFIVVNKTFTDGVHVGNLRLENSWQDLKGTDYVSTTVVLVLGKSVIWHASSKMAVYFMGRKNGSWFGNPAAIISTSPEVLKIGEVANSWQESLKYCKDQKMELVSFPEAQHQREVYGKLLQAQGASRQEVWIGMRRSSRSGEWYWLNGVPVNDTNWEEGEPGTVHDGQCAIMSLDENKNFGWSDKGCCEAAKPVCHIEPILLNIS